MFNILFFFYPFYPSLRKQQKLRGPAGPCAAPLTAGPFGGVGWGFFWGVCGLFFGVLCKALSVAVTARLREGGAPPPISIPRRGWGSARLCPLLTSWLLSVLRRGRAPPREGARAEEGEGGCRSPLPPIPTPPHPILLGGQLGSGGLRRFGFTSRS